MLNFVHFSTLFWIVMNPSCQYSGGSIIHFWINNVLDISTHCNLQMCIYSKFKRCDNQIKTLIIFGEHLWDLIIYALLLVWICLLFYVVMRLWIKFVRNVHNFTLVNLFSHVIDRFCIKYEYMNLKNAFRALPPIEIHGSNKTHTHHECASWRTSTSSLAKVYSMNTGLKPVFFQAAAKDVRDGFRYSRDYRWDKDMQTPACNLEILSDDFLVLVDVDYYINIKNLLLPHHIVPVMLYCFQPKAAGYSGKEFSFRFEADNSVEYTVAGGAKYTHKVWNYGVDTVTISGFSWNYLYRSVTYLVERRNANIHHEHVMLIPIVETRGLIAVLHSLLKCDVISRLEPVCGSFVRLLVRGINNLEMSTGAVGQFLSINIDVKIDDALRHISEAATLKLANSQVQSYVESKEGSALLTSYFRSKQTSKPPMVYLPCDGIKTYQLYKTKNFCDEMVPILDPYMSPLVPNCYLPAKGRLSESAAIEGRITLPLDEGKRLHFENFNQSTVKFIDEFVQLVKPNLTLSPFNDAEVSFRQSRPTQQRIIESSGWLAYGKRVIQSFLKAEAYEKPSDPRLISTYNGKDKVAYSKYIYAVTEYVSKFKWYTFGKQPTMIAKIVADICENDVLGVNCADANRMDGHVIKIVRSFEISLLLAMFSKEHHGEIIDLHEAQYGLKGYTPNGEVYSSETIRGSGSPETALFNTLLSKLIDYISRRIAGVNMLESFQAKGLFGGDDTITSSINPGLPGGEYIVKAGAMLGQSIENVFYKRGSFGVNYLSRQYTRGVWYGDINSSCDLSRMLSKLHVANRSNLSPELKLINKLRGLIHSDQNTPLINELIKAALRLGCDLTSEATYDQLNDSWWLQYPSGWPNELTEDFKNEICVISLNGADFVPAIDAMRAATTIGDLLELPAVLPVIFKQEEKNVLINDIIHEVPICKRFLAGNCDETRGKCKYQHVK